MEDVLPDAETAFIVFKTLDGHYVATPDLSLNMLVEREADRQDIKVACRELLDSAFKQELATEIMANIRESSRPESEKTAGSIRQALYDKGIL
jgi:hypothetical protein